MAKILKVPFSYFDDDQIEALNDTARRVFLARKAIGDNRSHQAEQIYTALLNSPSIDLTSFAATSLLLALHYQRSDKDIKKARSVFNNFVKTIHEYEAEGEDEGRVKDCNCGCGDDCTARVLQAFALFESRNNLLPKSAFLIRKAIEFDPKIASLLRWKMFHGLEHKVFATQLRPNPRRTNKVDNS
ncbi:hypothetical protein TrCOL_g5023 [Triparma columacea]|uniref:Uncharacterized protein n=1 Tax=Triparma columacea TaxID=722753 RepID=A0A9W7GAE0_9STRA|nr:hypothetical protein TrCOL_g5023 [Triparma columacea]